MTTTTREATRVRAYFDLTRSNSDTDGARNPAWVNASQTFEFIGGDLGPIPGTQRVAIHTANGETGELFGRDYLGRAVILVLA